MTRFRLLATVPVLSALLTACIRLPEPNAAPRPDSPISASASRTWDVVIDQLGERGIPLRAVEKASGFIATQPVALPPFSSEPAKWADCGTFASFRFAPTAVEYTFLIRGDSAHATVKSSARYLLTKSDGASAPPTECVSNGAFEAAFDASVKQRAEAKP
jgi:hypothetical protein